LTASFLALFAVAGCNSDDDGAPAAFTPGCDECLAREECSIPWETCTASDECKDYILCALRADCYSEAPGPTCVERAGCEAPAEGSESRDASDAFELCARTECVEICHFVEP
jgi:hypothetical protein